MGTPAPAGGRGPGPPGGIAVEGGPPAGNPAQGLAAGGGTAPV